MSQIKTREIADKALEDILYLLNGFTVSQAKGILERARLIVQSRSVFDSSINPN